MIISGVFGQTSKSQSIFKKMLLYTKDLIKAEPTQFQNGFLNIVVGKTSSTIDQGSIFKTNDYLLVGKIFNKNTYKEIILDDIQSLGPYSSSFVDQYWGNYLLVRVNDKQRTVTILRDPVGQLPLFYAKFPSGEIVFSSDISVIVEAIEKRPDFNWSYFSAHLLHTFITTKYTAFEGILELPHGCCLTLGYANQSLKTQVVWNPLDYCDTYKTLEYTQKDIVETASNVIKAWLKNTESVFLDFSGGLDSSALLFLLNRLLQPEQTLQLINRFHPEVQSADERKHARQVAQEIGLDLIEFDRSKSLPFTPLNHRMDFTLNWPTSSLTYLKPEQDLKILSKNYANVSHISGHGGDHIFFAAPSVRSLCDYLIEKGIQGFGNKLKDFSSLDRKPLLPILMEISKSSLGYIFLSYKRETCEINEYKNAPWLKSEVFQRAKTIPSHPFFDEKRKVLPGKFRLIDEIYNGLSTLKGNVRDPYNPIFYPLLSQPLLELALSIPTYESYQKGYSRYPFRKAIGDAFQTKSIWRKDKGDTTGVAQKALKKNEKYILELCLEGQIAKTGLIDKELLYDNLTKMMFGQTAYYWPISNLISSEIFINSWR